MCAKDHMIFILITHKSTRPENPITRADASFQSDLCRAERQVMPWKDWAQNKGKWRHKVAYPDDGLAI